MPKLTRNVLIVRAKFLIYIQVRQIIFFLSFIVLIYVLIGTTLLWFVQSAIDVNWITIAFLNHLSANVYCIILGNWKYFFCRIPCTNRSLICSKQVVHKAWVRTKVLPFNQMSSTGFSCGV